MSISLVQAKQTHCCRLCEKPITVGEAQPKGWMENFGGQLWPEAITLDFGHEFAHTACVEKLQEMPHDECRQHPRIPEKRPFGGWAMNRDIIAQAAKVAAEHTKALIGKDLKGQHGMRVFWLETDDAKDFIHGVLRQFNDTQALVKTDDGREMWVDYDYDPPERGSNLMQCLGGCEKK